MKIVSFLSLFILSGCGISDLRIEKTITNKIYVLDSIVLYQNDKRQHKYDSVNRHVVIRDTIYFGDENVLLDRIQYDLSMSTARYQRYRGNKILYGIYRDSLYMHDSGDIYRRAQHFSISLDSCRIILTQLIKGVNLKDKYYFSLVNSEKKR